MTNTRLITLTGRSLAATFVAVGIVFVAIPREVLEAFNWLAEGLGWPVSTTEPHTLYLGLALAYMYMVTVLAWQMARYPAARVFPGLLVHAKGASALISLGLFALQEQYLVYLANFVVDGGIAVFVWLLALKGRPSETPRAAPDRDND